MTVWNIQPSEFWQMHPTEFWWLYEANQKNSKSGSGDSDLSSLHSLLQAGIEAEAKEQAVGD